MTDRAPIVFDQDGTPMRVRMVGAECLGEMSGEGHYGYTETDEELTIYFEEIDLEEWEAERRRRFLRKTQQR